VVFYSSGGREVPADSILMMAADLPVFWWVATSLVPRDGEWPRIVGVALILVAIAIVGDFLIDTTGALLGFKAHWADGFSENLLSYPRWAFVVNAFNATVWAPHHRGADVPRAPLCDPPHSAPDVAGRAPERGHLRAAAWLRRSRIALGAPERRAMGGGLQADAQPPAGIDRPLGEQRHVDVVGGGAPADVARRVRTRYIAETRMASMRTGPT
jgi:hypothetical protein